MIPFFILHILICPLLYVNSRENIFMLNSVFHIRLNDSSILPSHRSALPNILQLWYL
jgi:hypothetical protein